MSWNKTDKSSQKRSPIKTPSLHLPGDSLRIKLLDVVFNKILIPIIAAISIGFTVKEWISYLWPQPNTIFTPISLSIFTIILVWLSIKKIIDMKEEVERIKLGIEGERVVGQALEELRKDGYRVFHDICGDGFNIDHVLIGPTGVYAIETKTKSKRNILKLIYDGATISYENGASLSEKENPLPQAKRSAKSLRSILFKDSGQTVYVTPVVLFPGWYIERKCNQEEVWVLNEKFLRSFLKNVPVSLPEPKITILSESLARYVRRNDGELSA